MSKSLAFVFPGQGSQQVGMLSELAEKYPIIETTFAEASEVLEYDLWKLVSTGPESELNQTHITQPALLTASVALWRLWSELSEQQPEILAGHSLGEYSALVCAGVIPFQDAVKLVRARGEFMQQAVPAGTGAMAAILGLSDDAVKNACEAAAQGDVVSPVNYNCPSQVVIAGEKEAVARAIDACKEAGAKRAIPLPVSVPSHCSLMKPAADRLAEMMDSIEFSPAQIPVVQNVTASVSSSTQEIKANLLSQLYSPVLWTDSIKQISSQGFEQTVECGPGKVLSGLNKKIDKSLTVLSIGDITGLEKALALN